MWAQETSKLRRIGKSYRLMYRIYFLRVYMDSILVGDMAEESPFGLSKAAFRRL